MRTIRKAPLAVLSAVLVTTAMAFAALAASAFEGVWKVEDTSGNPFEITLSADGKAKANRQGEGMVGTWTDDGKAATITWNTGWTTKIAKEGDGYTKTAFETGKAEAAKSTKAEKVK